MHTISQRSAEGILARLALFALSMAELAVALVWHGALWLVIWQERARERRRLASLDDYLLRDIGLSRSAIEREIRKPFWEG
ncbi:MAG TPA: DUF1127 domain-containing protein [Alphaproteobacteria bacterium]|nr:DUF1127 domain-containing protein [Alphaproteobacteria bacterium]